MDPLKVALLGGAHPHAADYVTALACEPRAHLASYFPGAMGNPALVRGPARAGSAEEALTGVDAAVIASTTAEHLALLQVAAIRGVPVLLEKPLERDTASATTVAETLDRCAHGSGVALFLRHSEAMRVLGETLTRRPERPRSVRLVFSHGQLSAWQRAPHLGWMTDPERGAVDSLADLGLHLLDLLAWIDPSLPLELVDRSSSLTPAGVLSAEGAATVRWGHTPVALATNWVGPDIFSAEFRWDDATVRYADGVVEERLGPTVNRTSVEPPAAAHSLSAFLRNVLADEPQEFGPSGPELLRVGAVLS